MNKTGSSSIQKSLARYSDDTHRYLRLGHPNHSALLSLAFLETPPVNILTHPAIVQRGLTPEGARGALRQALRRDRRSVVISGEGLSANFGPAAIDAVLALLREEVDEIAAIAYLRDPASYAVSNFQQMARLGQPPADVARMLPRYRRRLGPWRRVLGRASVTFVAFDPGGFAEGGLVADFAQRVGLDLAEAGQRLRRANPTPSAEATAVLYALHRHMGHRRVPDSLLPAGRVLVGLLRDFGAARFAWSAAALAPGLARRASDIAWAEACMGRAMPVPDFSGRLVFDSAADLRDYAATLGPALAAHLAAKGYDAPGVETDPAGGLAQLLRKIADTSSAPSAA